MADSVKELCMAALASEIAASATGVKRVNRDPRVGPTSGSMPLVNLFEISDDDSEFGPDTPNLKVTRSATVMLEIWESGKSDAPTRINNLDAKIEKQVKSNHRLGGNAIDVRFGPARNFVSDDKQFVGIQRDLTILYRYTLADPFTP